MICDGPVGHGGAARRAAVVAVDPLLQTGTTEASTTGPAPDRIALDNHIIANIAVEAMPIIVALAKYLLAIGSDLSPKRTRVVEVGHCVVLGSAKDQRSFNWSVLDLFGWFIMAKGHEDGKHRAHNVKQLRNSNSVLDFIFVSCSRLIQ